MYVQVSLYNMSRLVTCHNVVGKNSDVLLAVCPRVFMMETQSVKDLMDDVTHLARGPDKHRLLAANEAHI